MPYSKKSSVKIKIKNVLRPLLSPFAHRIRRTSIFKKHLIPWLIHAETGCGEQYSEIQDLKKKLKSIAHSGKPIIVGPWLSEVGFEVLYWIPFLRWVADTFGIDTNRLYVVSRGGCNQWYAGICGTYTDIFEFFSESEFKEKNEQRISDTGGQKHLFVSKFDKEIIACVTEKHSLSEYELLHPLYMYELFRFFWRRRLPISFIEKHVSFQRFKIQSAQDILSRLPEKYIAVKFYFSACFPDTPDNRTAIKHLLRHLSRNCDVVMLSTTFSIDDHDDFHSDGANHRIISAADMMSLRDNLDVQTQIIANAQAFFGTYGGFSYVAPLCGVPSFAFYSRLDLFVHGHLDVAYRMSRFLKCGHFDKINKTGTYNQPPDKPEFTAFDIHNLPLLETIFKSENKDDITLRSAS
ncbi:MAG: hypothetical protein AB1454_07800 [Candidatus Auribacterota bacterium]